MFNGEKLRQMRETYRLTQSFVSEQIGVGYKRVGMWERGEAEPSPANLEAL